MQQDIIWDQLNHLELIARAKIMNGLGDEQM